jgi:hypothetical protein
MDRQRRFGIVRARVLSGTKRYLHLALKMNEITDGLIRNGHLTMHTITTNQLPPYIPRCPPAGETALSEPVTLIRVKRYNYPSRHVGVTHPSRDRRDTHVTKSRVHKPQFHLFFRAHPFCRRRWCTGNMGTSHARACPRKGFDSPTAYLPFGSFRSTFLYMNHSRNRPAARRPFARRIAVRHVLKVGFREIVALILVFMSSPYQLDPLVKSKEVCYHWRSVNEPGLSDSVEGKGKPAEDDPCLP